MNTARPRLATLRPARVGVGRLQVGAAFLVEDDDLTVEQHAVRAPAIGDCGERAEAVAALVARA
jgi:hypothetical protein